MIREGERERESIIKEEEGEEDDDSSTTISTTSDTEVMCWDETKYIRNKIHRLDSSNLS